MANDPSTEAAGVEPEDHRIAVFVNTCEAKFYITDLALCATRVPNESLRARSHPSQVRRRSRRGDLRDQHTSPTPPPNGLAL